MSELTTYPLLPELANAVRAIYAAADAEVAQAGPRCDASGRCCRFTEWGHVLYLCHLEAAVLLADAPTYTKPVGPDSCPFQVQRLCTAREQRPLGCRVYFCDPDYQQRAGEITEKYLGQLKQLAQTHQVGWQYAPLHVFLNACVPTERSAQHQPCASTPSSPSPAPSSLLSSPTPPSTEPTQTRRSLPLI